MGGSSDDDDHGEAKSGGSTTVTSTMKRLQSRIKLLEQQVAACMESQPLLYQVFNKCNAMEQRLRTMKKEVDERLAPFEKEKKSRHSRKRYHSEEDVEEKGPDQFSPVTLAHSNLDPELDDDWLPDNGDDDDEAGSEQAFVLELDMGNMGTETKPLHCKFCPGTPKQLFDDAAGLANHYTAKHRIVDDDIDNLMTKSAPSPKRKSATIANQRGYPCPECGTVFSRILNMKRHVACMHTEPTHKCKKCDMAFRRKDGLKGHMFKVHGIKVPGRSRYHNDVRQESNKSVDSDGPNTESGNDYNPPVPSEPSANSAAPGSTKEQGDGEESEDPLNERTCPKCGLVLSSGCNMRRHMISTHEAPRIKCDLCDRKFCRQDTLKEHQLRVHGRLSETVRATRRQKTGRIPCSGACGRTFPNESIMRKHLARNCESAVSYPCDYDSCSEIFTTLKSLREHRESTHIGVDDDHDDDGERATCKMCGERVLKINLRRHMETKHLGIKRHVCETCGARFRDAYELRKHQLRHKGGRSFICHFATCNRGFSDEHALKKHSKIHTGIGKFVCEDCGSTCGTAVSLAIHKRRHKKAQMVATVEDGDVHEDQDEDQSLDLQFQ